MTDTPTRIVIATGNPHKVAELRELLALPGLEFVGLADLPGSDGFDEPEETGSTFEENATIKALSYARQTGLPCLADDSGLEVDALGGAPGVISSHYCTDGRETGMSRDERDKANNEKLLSELGETDGRDGRFVCVMVLACPDPEPSVIATVRGTFDGRIGVAGDVPRGTNGFGYDPLFLVLPGFDRTSAELEPAEKGKRSHRGAAARLMLGRLRSIAELAQPSRA